MKKIESLTKEQESQMLIFRDECLKIGLNTNPIKREIKEHREIIDYIYKNYLNLDSPAIWYVDSPLMLNLIINILPEIIPEIEKELESNLRSNIESNLRSNLRSNLVENNSRFENIYWSNLDIYWICFYLFPQTLGIKYSDFETKSLNVFHEMTKKCGFIWYFKGICFISDRPSHIHKKGIQLHHETEPAISFRDGYSVWCLNGVNVPRYLVETSKENLTIEQFNKEKNADVRAEFIRKFGIERMVSLGKVVDSYHDKSGEWERRSEYQLVNMGNVFGRDSAMFLKMKNQSTGIYHFEGVSPECKTVKEALNFRYGSGIEIQSIK